MKNTYQSGMTLIELIIVIVVMSILAGVASIKIGSSSSVTVGQQADLVVSQIRHAQSLAQNWGCQLKVIVSTTAYEVRSKNTVTGKPQCVANNLVTDPSTGNNLQINLDYGAQFSSTGSFDFDIKGVPRNTVSNAILATPTPFILTGGSSTYTISVSHITGFVSSTGP